MAELHRAEVLRYLGVKTPVPELAQTLDRAEGLLLSAAVPKGVWREFPLTAEGNDLCFAGLTVQSRDLARHLEGCSSVILLCATLGLEVDRLLTRLSLTDTSAAVAVQACAAALLEAFCDEQCAAMAQAQPHRFLRPRFSPGYGDFSPEVTPSVLAALEAGKTVGLSATAAHMLVPTKSVTAVIGLADTPGAWGKSCTTPAGCTACKNLQCTFRREGSL